MVTVGSGVRRMCVLPRSTSFNKLQPAAGVSAARGGEQHDPRHGDDKAGELQHVQRLAEQRDRERDREQRRQVAECARHHRAERVIGGEREQGDRARKHEADRGEDRHGAPHDGRVAQCKRRCTDEQQRRRRDADRGPRKRGNVAQAELRQYQRQAEQEGGAEGERDAGHARDISNESVC